jgi:arylamine N-acetyltransferase
MIFYDFMPMRSILWVGIFFLPHSILQLQHCYYLILSIFCSQNNIADTVLGMPDSFNKWAYYECIGITPEVLAGAVSFGTDTCILPKAPEYQSGLTVVPATIHGLKLIVSHHANSHPYQNVDLVLARIDNNSVPVAIDAATLEQKFVYKRRGGMCYEGSEFLYHVLISHGFDVRRIAAMPLNNNPYDPGIPYTHNILFVTAEDQHFIVDPFFGYNGLREPMLFNEAAETQEFHVYEFNERYKLQRFDDHYVMYIYVPNKNEWFSMYRFERPLSFVNYEETCRLHHNLMTHALRPIPIRDQFIKIGSINSSGRVGFHIDFFDTNSRFILFVRDGVAEKLFFTPDSLDELVNSIPKYIPHLDAGIVEDVKYILRHESK